MEKYMYKDDIEVEIYNDKNIAAITSTLVKITWYAGQTYRDRVYVAKSLQWDVAEQNEDPELIKFIKEKLEQFKADTTIAEKRLLAFTRWYDHEQENRGLEQSNYKDIQKAFCNTDYGQIKPKKYKYVDSVHRMHSIFNAYTINISGYPNTEVCVDTHDYKEVYAGFRIEDINRIIDNKGMITFIQDRVQDLTDIITNFGLWYNINYEDVKDSDYNNLKHAFIAGFNPLDNPA